MKIPRLNGEPLLSLAGTCVDDLGADLVHHLIAIQLSRLHQISSHDLYALAKPVMQSLDMLSSMPRRPIVAADSSRCWRRGCTAIVDADGDTDRRALTISEQARLKIGQQNRLLHHPGSKQGRRRSVGELPALWCG